MTTPAEALRAALDDFRAVLAAHELARWRGTRAPRPPAELQSVQWLMSEAASEAMAEALDSGEIDADQHAWLQRQGAWGGHAVRQHPLRDWLPEALGEATLPGGQPLRLGDELGELAVADDPEHRRDLAGEVLAALQPVGDRWLAAHVALAPPPRAPGAELTGVYLVGVAQQASQPAQEQEPHPFATLLRTFLDETHDAARDAVAWIARGAGKDHPVAWHSVLHGLRAHDLDSPQAARERGLRAAAVFRKLGFEWHLDSRLRAQTHRGAVLPRAYVVAPRVPEEVRVGLLARDWGVLADLAAAEAVGLALGHALVLPTLPPELRWPLGGGAADALGKLARGMWADRVFLQRVQGLSERPSDEIARITATASLLEARTWAALATLGAPEADRPAQRLELLTDALSAALCCEVPSTLAALIGADAALAPTRAQAALAGLALVPGLRERFDEDWFRNVRVADPIRDACARGNPMSATAFCEEQGVSLDAAIGRVIELLA
jgi:hypothetical protein